ERRALGGRQPFSEGFGCARRTLRVKLHDGDHALFYGPWDGSPSGAGGVCCASTASTMRCGSTQRRRSASCRARPSCASSRSFSWRKKSSSARMSWTRSEEHTSELQSLAYLVCRLLLEKKKNI